MLVHPGNEPHVGQDVHAMVVWMDDQSPLVPGKVGLYVCGVTVYDRCHVGHARSLVFFDTMVRYLRFAGYAVNFVRLTKEQQQDVISRTFHMSI